MKPEEVEKLEARAWKARKLLSDKQLVDVSIQRVNVNNSFTVDERGVYVSGIFPEYLVTSNVYLKELKDEMLEALKRVENRILSELDKLEG